MATAIATATELTTSKTICVRVEEGMRFVKGRRDDKARVVTMTKEREREREDG